MQRYFVESVDITNGEAVITGDDVKHISRVMRYQIGDQVICSDHMGNSYQCAISAIDTKQVDLRIVAEIVESNEPMTKITLYQGLMKADKMEWVLQKGTEIGISAFVPVEMKFSVTKWEADRRDKKLDRWRKIVKEAAEQSHRSIIPDVQSAISFQSLVKERAGKHSLTVLAYEKSEHSQGILALIRQYPDIRDVAIIIGPEGGVSEQERLLAIEHGVQLVNLGPRILRAETAGLIAAAGVLFINQELGEL